MVVSSITRTYKPNILEINSAIFKSWEEFLDKYDINDCYRKPFYANVVRRLDETLRLYFVNPSNKNSIFTKIKTLSDIVKTEPYNIAIRNVEISKLQKRHKMIVALFRRNIITLTWIMYYIYLHR
jgi:hypothetical protein